MDIEELKRVKNAKSKKKRTYLKIQIRHNSKQTRSHRTRKSTALNIHRASTYTPYHNHPQKSTHGLMSDL